MRMTRRAVMFPGFSNWDGPSNNCRRLDTQTVWKRAENSAWSQSDNLSLFYIDIAPSSHVWRTVSSGSASAVVCQVLRWVWIIRLVTTTLSLMSRWVWKCVKLKVYYASFSERKKAPTVPKISPVSLLATLPSACDLLCLFVLEAEPSAALHMFKMGLYKYLINVFSFPTEICT